MNALRSASHDRDTAAYGCVGALSALIRAWDITNQSAIQALRDYDHADALLQVEWEKIEVKAVA